MSTYQALTFHNGGIRLEAVAAGPEHGIPVLLLHGFPEFWYGWRRQIQPLANAGFRVVAPNQRGYGPSDAPKSVSDYALPHLTADVLAIADQLGWARFCLAGHDWGAVWHGALPCNHLDACHA